MSHQTWRADEKIANSKVWFSHVREEVLTDKIHMDGGSPVFRDHCGALMIQAILLIVGIAASGVTVANIYRFLNNFPLPDF